MSGGVDSSVAALLVRRAGLEAFGVYMHNWDAGDEAGGSGAGACTSERDLQDAREVAGKLRMPLVEADFVGRYWSEVFSGFISGVAAGVTPNPDLTCNAAIKFGALWEFAAARGADAVATGHYARLGRPGAAAAVGAGGDGGGCATVEPLGPLEAWGWRGGGGGGGDGVPLLLRGVDLTKDQSYFLAGVSGRQLAHAMFPLGSMRKSEVRAIASSKGLRPASKRSSAGICFIGRRSFGEFIEQYVPPVPGRFVCADTGADLGPCHNLLSLTHGQRAPLSGGAGRRYVAGKDLSARVAWVAEGHGHPATLSSEALLLPAHWVAGAPPEALAAAAEGAGGDLADPDGWVLPGLRCSCKARYRHPDVPCLVQAAAKPGRPTVVPLVRASGGSGNNGSSGNSYGSSSSSSSSSGGAGNSGVVFRPTRFVGSSTLGALLAAPRGAAAKQHPGGSTEAAGDVWLDGAFLRLRTDVPIRGLSPGQAVVMYDGEVALGSALLAAPGETLLEAAAYGDPLGSSERAGAAQRAVA